MKISLDFGGSTTDLIIWDNGEIKEIKSFEFNDVGVIENLDNFFDKFLFDLKGISEIFVTGGRSRKFTSKYKGIPVVNVSEIDAIGTGGKFLAEGINRDFLVVSMGTGTCMVKVSKDKFEHIGGTGVGGGTFLALVREMLSETDVRKVLEMFEKGDLSKVDLSVGDIVGSNIGMIKTYTTASNLGKLSREIDFSKEDLACGIVNLIGQTIATAACFGAKACNCDLILLGGKLTRIKPILGVIQKVADLYDISLVVPEKGEYLSAIGACVE